MSYQPKIYRKQGGDELVVENGGKITIKSGGELELQAGAIADLADEILAAADIALADGKILIGDVADAAAAKTPSGDLTMTREGVVTIANDAITAAKLKDSADTDGDRAVTTNHIRDDAVTAAKIASGAGLAALAADEGLGASAAYPKTHAVSATHLAAAAVDRVVLILVHITTTFAAGDGAAPVFDIGEEDTLEKFKADLNAGNAGDILVFSGTLSATKALKVSGTAATGTGDGAITVTVLALPAAA